MQETYETWMSELEERQKELEERISEIATKKGPLEAKINIAETSKKYFRGDQEQVDYIQKKFVDGYVGQLDEVESSIKEMIKERRAISAMIDEVKLKIEGIKSR